MTSQLPEWPGGARCAVLVSFDLDGPAGHIDHNAETWFRPRDFSAGSYDQVRGTPRLLDLLDSKGLKGTFFTPGWCVEQWPDLFLDIIDRGHEVGHHGYMHELYSRRTLDEVTVIIERAQSAFERVAGIRALGFRTPSGDFPVGSSRLLRDLGFEYSSSMRGDDRPYRWESEGNPTDLIEIPGAWTLDDFPHFGYLEGGDRIGGLRWLYNNWVREFDAYHREGLCYPLMMHPGVMGTPARAELLARLLDHILAKGDVWVATGKEIADWWREKY